MKLKKLIEALNTTNNKDLEHLEQNSFCHEYA